MGDFEKWWDAEYKGVAGTAECDIARDAWDSSRRLSRRRLPEKCDFRKILLDGLGFFVQFTPMPKPPSPAKDFRPRIENAALLFQLAKITRRRPNEEVNVAVDNHLESNRSLLRRGPKLNP